MRPVPDRKLLDVDVLVEVFDAWPVADRDGQVLADLDRDADQGRFDLRIAHHCAEHDPCWTITCVRCERMRVDHVREDVLADHVRRTVSGHRCHGPRLT